MAIEDRLIPWERIRTVIEGIPVVQRLTPGARAAFEEDMRAMTRGGLTAEQFWFSVEERLRQYAYDEHVEPLTPEELEEIERRADEAEAHPEQSIPWEELRAKLGITEGPTADLFAVEPPLTEAERRFLEGAARSADEAEAALQALSARALAAPERCLLFCGVPDEEPPPSPA